jgi:hypothetical protein
VITYSTCLDCGGLLYVTRPSDKVHPTCRPKTNKAEALTKRWLTAVETGNTQREHELHTQIEELENQPPRLLDAALIYASWGWPVFPLLPTSLALRRPDPFKASKTPATKNGFKDATTDPDTIRSWWERHPDCGIGLPTGHQFDVIDIDTPDGIPTYQQFLTNDKTIHGKATTASGGIHLYINPTGTKNKVRWRPGADYRGLGGYVAAAPTRLLGDRRYSYTWAHRPSPFITGQGDTYGVVV